MNPSKSKTLEMRWRSPQRAALFALFFLYIPGNPSAARVLLHCDFAAPTSPPPTLVTSAECIDQNGMAKPVTIGGNPTWGNGRPGNGPQTGQAVVFDGASDYLLLTGSPLLHGSSQLTVEAWVQVTGSPTNIFRVQQPVGLDGNRALVLNSQQGSPWFVVTSGSPTPTGWYHVATVFDRGELRFYVNGRLSNVSIVDIEEVASSVSYTDWALGARYLGGSADQFFDGSIDEVTVYDEALPARTLLENARNSVLTVTHDVTMGPNPALGDGVTDDAQAIQDRLDAAAAGGDEVYIPSGIYRLGKTLRMPSGILVRGEESTILEPIENLTTPVNPIFAFDEDAAGDPVVESTVRDLQIHGRSSEIAQNAGHAAVILTGTQRCHVDGLEVSDLGRTKAARAGIQILLQSLSLGSQPGAGRDSVGNVI
ncbi:MAG: hypothetical protein MI919_06455, partial [Holophagales bacterium]|nr:hypothetical protein [Holophagales bacterium]